MKKKTSIVTLLCAVLFAVSFMSSSETSTSSSLGSRKGYFKMKLDGVLKVYDTCYSSGFQQDVMPNQTYYQVNIFGGRPGDYCGIYANDLSPVKKGVYTSAINPVTTLPMAGLGAYRPQGSTDTYISYHSGWPMYDITITLTEFTPDHIKGTFQGKLRLIGGDKVIDVTDGEFEGYNN